MCYLDPELRPSNPPSLSNAHLPGASRPKGLGFPLPLSELGPEQRVQAGQCALDRAAVEIAAIKRLGDSASYEQSVLRIAEQFVDIHAISNLSFALVDLDNSEANKSCRETLQRLKRELDARIFQDAGLYSIVNRFNAPEARVKLLPAEQRLLDNTLHDFREHGVQLDQAGRARMTELAREIDESSNRFMSNLREASDRLRIVVEDRELLKGLAPTLIDSAQNGANRWCFDVGDDHYYGVMQFAHSPELKHRMFEAFKNRCSAGTFDNEQEMRTLLRLRAEMADLLGYENAAAHRNCDHSLKSAAEIAAFLLQICDAAKPAYRTEVAKMNLLKQEQLGPQAQPIDPWEELYYRRQLKERSSGIDLNELRQYFELNGVLQRLFEMTKREFGIEIVEIDGVETWHPDVRVFGVHDHDEARLGYVYMDLFARANKFDNGASLQPVVDPLDSEGARVPAVSILACNFQKSDENGRCLLSHEDFAGILLHEFFHALHFSGARVTRPSEMDGVEPFDFLETPSQFGENYGWSRFGLAQLARHVDTGAPLDDAVITALSQSRAADAGCIAMNDVANALMDQALHTGYDPRSAQSVSQFVDEQLVPLFGDGPRLSTRPAIFEHIFVEEYGYSTAYYTYLFTNIAEADLYETLESMRASDPTAGRRLYQEVLAPGNSRDPMIGVRAFLGREPNAAAWGRRLANS